MLIGSLNLSGPSLVLKKVKDFISDQHSPQANNNPSTLVEVNQAILAWSLFFLRTNDGPLIFKDLTNNHTSAFLTLKLHLGIVLVIKNLGVDGLHSPSAD